MKKAKDQPGSEPAELASLVGERIRKIRKEEGLSLELFALRCDMNAAYVGHIERGVQNPTLNTLERICKGLDISVEDLFIDKSATVDMNYRRIAVFLSDYLRSFARTISSAAKHHKRDRSRDEMTLVIKTPSR